MGNDQISCYGEALQDHIPRGKKGKMNSGWEKNKSQGIDKFI